VGSPNRLPSDAELMHLMATAPNFVFLGMGRFLSYVSPKVVASQDLRGCDVALIFGHVNNAKAHQRQLYLDNR
jgi:hypothetical protein